jgi:hypothetical protein
MQPMKFKQSTILAATFLMFDLMTTAAAESGPVKRYRGTGSFPGEPSGQVTPILPGDTYELKAFGPAPVQPSNSGSHYVARLGSKAEFEWGLTTFGPSRGGLELKLHPSEPLVFASLIGLVDEEFWTVFGMFDGRTGARRFERGFRAILNKIDEIIVIPHPFSRVDLLPSGKIAFIEDDHSDSLKIGVLDSAGEPVWQKMFVSPSLKQTSSKQMNAIIREDIQTGWWVLLSGTEAKPEPKPAQRSPVFHLLRLNDLGNPLWIRKMMNFAPGVQAASTPITVFDKEGGMLLFKVDLPPSALPAPIPKSAAQFVYFDSEGRVRWARAFPDALGNQAPVWNLAKTALYLQLSKLTSLTPLKVDTWFLKLDAKSGEILRSIKFETSATTELKICGVSEQQLFVSGSQTTRAFVGYFDLDLKELVWRKFQRTDLRNGLTAQYDSIKNRLSVSVSPRNAGWADLISLQGNLQIEGLVSIDPISEPCQFFTEDRLPFSDVPLASEPFALEQSESTVEVRETTIDLVPSTRLDLKPFTMEAEDLCKPAAGGSLKAPDLKIKTKASGAGFELLFPTEFGVNYEVLYSPSLHRTFESMVLLPGDGGTTEYPINVADSHEGYYTVRASRY